MSSRDFEGDGRKRSAKQHALSCLLIALGCCCLSLVGGCAGGKSPARKLVPVTGTVFFGGQPLGRGTITFVSDSTSGINAAGEIDASGKYALSSERPGDGAAPGSYKVRIESWSSPPRMDETGTDPGKPAIPEKYFDSQQSGLTATISDENAPQVIDFRLTP